MNEAIVAQRILTEDEARRRPEMKEDISGLVSELLDNTAVVDLAELLAAIHCRQWLNELSKSANCCKTPVLVAELPLKKSGPHFKKAVCAACGKFNGWIPSPKNIARRPTGSTGQKRGTFCVICMARTGLETHHIIEVASGGSDEQENRLTVCAGCHALIHWRRKYLERPE